MHRGPESESPVKEVVGGMGSGLIGLHSKGTLLVQLFTISRNRLTLEGAVLPGSGRPQNVQTSDYNRRYG